MHPLMESTCSHQPASNFLQILLGPLISSSALQWHCIPGFACSSRMHFVFQMSVTLCSTCSLLPHLSHFSLCSHMFLGTDVTSIQKKKISRGKPLGVAWACTCPYLSVYWHKVRQGFGHWKVTVFHIKLRHSAGYSRNRRPVRLYTSDIF